ncbi:G-protein coupled receptor 4-like [Epinephelus fuscoguttatus]|uniref:G-protein coupled receptor 4-like n=1 Tax=Epinephelus fuscoguttatus TaxID=293821 RepID=UPI0020D1B6D2|nr:G-protein coupled receptor 4-like [Epinephelus fuscoguttatus]
MEDLHINNTSQDNRDIFDYYYIFTSFDTFGHTAEAEFIINVVTCVILSIGLPLTLMAIYALYSQVRNDHVAPIYIINLLISDVIQFCYMIIEVVLAENLMIYVIFFNIYIYCLQASVGFMVCVALERYLVIACPLWYRFRRTIKISVLVCVVVWVLPALCHIVSFCSDPETAEIIVAVFLLLPLPLLIFFLGGTLRALSASISVPSDEKRRIVGLLVLVLLIYTLLFLPSIIWFIATSNRNNYILHIAFPVFLKLSPLADLVLYVFMRKGAIDRLLAAVCCCRMSRNENRSTAVSVVTTHPQSASSRQRQRETVTEIEEGTENM